MKQPLIQSLGTLMPALPFLVVFFVTPTLALLAGPSVATTFVVLGVGCLVTQARVVGAIFRWRQGGGPRKWFLLTPRFSIGLSWLVVGILLWSLLTCLWSPSPAFSVWLRLVGVATAGVITLWAATRLDEVQRRVARWGLFAGLGLASSVLFIESLCGYPLTILTHSVHAEDAAGVAQSILSRGTVVLLLLTWPILTGKSWRLGLLILPLALPSLVISGKHVVLSALPAALLVSVLVMLVPSLSIRLGRLLVTASVLLAPFLVQNLPSPAELGRHQIWNSALHRDVIWTFSAARIAEKPWFGWGLDAARELPGGDSVTVVRAVVDDLGTEMVRSFPNMPLHPHNAILQVWLELGLPGALFLAGIMWCIWSGLLHAALPRWHKALRAGALTCAVIVACVSFGAWQTWWLSTLCFVGVAFIVFNTASTNKFEYKISY